MYLADYHTHTQFSPDAHDPMTVMAQAALDAGMDEICFTDHVEPLTWGSNELRPPYDWSALTEDFANVQAGGPHPSAAGHGDGRRAEGPGPHEKAVGGRAAV